MAFLRSAVLTALVAGGGCAYAQPSASVVNDEDQALVDAKIPYRGYAPFAVAAKSPFGGREWFVLSFFEYWTGYETTGDATKHYVIRRVSGLREGYEDGVEKAATAASTTWALSDDCPKLRPAIDRFELRSEAGFTSKPNAPYSPKIVRLMANDFSGLVFWANLSNWESAAEVDLMMPYAGSPIGNWVQGLLVDTNDCFALAPPEIPAANFPEDPAKSPPPFSIFDF